MVKLTLEVLQLSYSFINALREWELDLRDNKLPAVENLGATQDQYDTIDFTNNDIRRFENFPLMPRLRSILMANNRVHRIDPEISSFLPNLEVLILSYNQIEDLGELEGILRLKKLQYLSLVENPVQEREYYRLYIISRLPRLKMLDFKKVKETERAEATEFFASKQGRSILEIIQKSPSRQLEAAGTFVIGSIDGKPQQKSVIKESAGLSAEETEKIKVAIRQAKTLDEVARLEKLLRSGRIPEATGSK